MTDLTSLRPSGSVSDSGILFRRLAAQLAKILDNPRYDSLSMIARIDLSVSRADRPVRRGDGKIACFTCRTAPAGWGTAAHAHSAYCRSCAGQTVAS